MSPDWSHDAPALRKPPLFTVSAWWAAQRVGTLLKLARRRQRTIMIRLGMQPNERAFLVPLRVLPPVRARKTRLSRSSRMPRRAP